MAKTEQVLSGGQNTVTIRNELVTRPTHPWSQGTRLLLDHCRSAGLAFVPAYKGTDNNGNQLLEYIEGTVGHYPLECWMLSDQAVASAGRILREFHEVSRELVSSSGICWQFPSLEPAEVICHGDFAPYNCVYCNEEVHGLIDFDGARVGPRCWDLSYALYRFAPFVGMATLEDGFGDIPTRLKRARTFIDAYGGDEATLKDALHMIPMRLRSLIEWMHDEAGRGNKHTVQNLKDGHHLLYAEDANRIENLFG